MKINSALKFLNQQADPLARARLRYTLYGEPPPAEALDQLTAGQRPDGGWAPFWARDYSSVDATCFRLAQAEQLGLLSAHPAIDRAARFLSARQSPDGSWQESEQLAGQAPPWAHPGDPAARLYLTANCGYWLARLASQEHASQAGKFLAAALDNQGRLPSFLQTYWLGAALWRLLDEHELAQRLLAYLDLRLEDMPAGNLAWMVLALTASGLPAETSSLRAACERLEALQGKTGAWPGEDGATPDVHVTLEALRALKVCSAHGMHATFNPPPQGKPAL
jgi:hypothetical protein